jgi:hypothetical protein
LTPQNPPPPLVPLLPLMRLAMLPNTSLPVVNAYSATGLPCRRFKPIPIGPPPHGVTICSAVDPVGSHHATVNTQILIELAASLF